MSSEDKQDMLDGLICVELLIAHVGVWRDNGMGDCTNGTGAPYRNKTGLPMQRYRGHGKSG